MSRDFEHCKYSSGSGSGHPHISPMWLIIWPPHTTSIYYIPTSIYTTLITRILRVIGIHFVNIFLRLYGWLAQNSMPWFNIIKRSYPLVLSPISCFTWLAIFNVLYVVLSECAGCGESISSYVLHWYCQGSIKPPEAAKGHATSVGSVDSALPFLQVLNT